MEARRVGSLYARCLSALVSRLKGSLHRLLPDTVLLDLYQTMYKEKRRLLVAEMSNIDVLFRILKTNHSRLSIMRYFQVVIELGVNLSERLSTAYVKRCKRMAKVKTVDVERKNSIIDLGLRLGGFLNDAGWYAHAEIVLSTCKDLCQSTLSAHHARLTLECCHRLLHAQSSYRRFEDASNTYDFSSKLLNKALDTSHLRSLKLPNRTENGVYISITPAAADPPPPSLLSLLPRPKKVVKQGTVEKAKKVMYHEDYSPSLAREINNLLLRLFKEFSIYHFLRSDYNDTYKWSMKALELLKDDTPSKISIEVLCICGKACVMMRKFSWAELLIQQAVVRARTYYGRKHPKYAFALLDYGFYFLNVDSILNSVTVYEEALAILHHVYHNGNNLHVAIAFEDLSYALYVHEYSSGRFYKAREHVDRAIHIMESLLPPKHLMLATTKRVKALILEEIALDSPPGENPTDLLDQSEMLHKSALTLSLNAFGEMNVQTAKHYGNLGRLYQSMRKFEEAEKMQLRAIRIKEKLLGTEDYEVGLSLGHLASLYNYHMRMFLAAEKLYYRSISISLKSFGEEYSGLEYDYIGLIHVNNELKRPERAAFYTQLLHQWRRMRDLASERQHPDFGKEVEIPVAEVQSEVFGMNDDLGCR